MGRRISNSGIWMKNLRLVSFTLFLLAETIYGQSATNQRSHGSSVSVAFASFAPLNTDIFGANADGSDARPLLPNPALD